MKRRIIIGLFYLIGLILLTLGISMMIIADLGIGPWDALYVALAEKVGLSVGSWVFIAGFLLIFINGFLLKKIPDFSALITMFIIGIFIDFWLEVAFLHVELTALPIRTLILLSGIVTIAAGVSMYLQSNFARNPIDNLMMAVHYRTGKSLSFSKTVIELSILVLAFTIGGPIGIGTIIVAVVIGPIIQILYKQVSKFRTFLCPTEELNKT